MGDEDTLSPAEDRLWRALVRVATILPRTLDEDLRRETPLTLTEFAALLHLSEAADGRARMSDLAAMTGLSASRISRVCVDLETRGLIEKGRNAEDARSNLVVITSQGRAKFGAAYPVQAAGARRLVFDGSTPQELQAAMELLERTVDRLRNAESR